MKLTQMLALGLSVSVAMSSCVAKKKYVDLQKQLEVANADLEKRGNLVNEFKNKLVSCEQEKEALAKNNQSAMQLRDEQITDLRSQVADLKKLRDTQMEQVGNLTVLTQTASKNVDRTLAQLEQKDQYIAMLMAAKNKADSINLALAVNLKGVLAEGIADQDVDIKVDKTVVFVNLSDRMLYNSGSYRVTPKAKAVLGKIAQIIKSRPDLDVMIEGYTDNVSINTDCIDDNWDLSVKRATSVVRILQKDHGVDPNKLIAAGRGEFNTLASNDTKEGRQQNRRTRIILMPRLNQFYDLLNPDLAVGKK
ncbi:MAG: OmpA family protein [Spirosomataceae bacterium]